MRPLSLVPKAPPKPSSDLLGDDDPPRSLPPLPMPLLAAPLPPLSLLPVLPVACSSAMAHASIHVPSHVLLLLTIPLAVPLLLLPPGDTLPTA